MAKVETRPLSELIAEHERRDPSFRAALQDEDELFDMRLALVAARVRADLKQKAVAQRMGTKQSAVSAIEHGSSDPRISTLMRYARAVDCRLQIQVKRAHVWPVRAPAGEAHAVGGDGHLHQTPDLVLVPAAS